MQPAFIFSNRFIHKIARHAFFWLAWLIFFAVIYGYKGLGVYRYSPMELFFISFGEAFLFWPIHLVFSYMILYFLIPNFVLKGRYLALIPWMIVLVFLVGIISWACTEWLVNPYRHLFNLHEPYNSLAFGMMAGVRGGLTVGGFAASIKLIKLWYTKQLENQQLQSAHMKAELELLKGQLHPHFLFNTLNNIYASALSRQAQTPDMILQLSGMLQYMLYDGAQPYVSLQKEVEMVENYIHLEKQRFGDRLDFSFQVSGPLDRHSIAPLLLLPFVENAFKHGAENTTGTIWITIDLRVNDDQLSLKVINGAHDPNTFEKVGNTPSGIGLKNVQQRLSLLYPQQHQLQIIPQNDSFIVNLNLQLPINP